MGRRGRRRDRRRDAVATQTVQVAVLWARALRLRCRRQRPPVGVLAEHAQVHLRQGERIITARPGITTETDGRSVPRLR